MPTSPSIEKSSNNPDPAFQKDEASTLLKSGNYNKVPLMIGYTDMEGLLVGILQNMHGEKFTILKTDTLIPHNFHICKNGDKKEARERINDYYYGGIQPGVEDTGYLPKFVNLSTDAYFMHGIVKSAKLHANTMENPVYLYKFTMDTRLNIFKRVFPSTSKYRGKWCYLLNSF